MSVLTNDEARELWALVNAAAEEAFKRGQVCRDLESPLSYAHLGPAARVDPRPIAGMRPLAACRCPICDGWD